MALEFVDQSFFGSHVAHVEASDSQEKSSFSSASLGRNQKICSQSVERAQIFASEDQIDSIPRLEDEDKLVREPMLLLLDNAVQELSLQSEEQKHCFPDLKKEGRMPLEQVLENN